MADTCVNIRGADSLRHEYERTRETLRDTDATIEKLTGRPAFAGRGFPRRPMASRTPGDELYGRPGNAGALFSLANYDTPGPPAAKRFAPGISGTFGRLGLPLSSQRTFQPRRQPDDEEDDDLPHKPSLQSSVIVTPKETKSRKDAILEQQSGAGGEVGANRNRRMFGLLLGTLVKFQQDERNKEEQVGKRKAVEKRLEEKQREERDRVIRERQQLFTDRRRHQAKLRALEHKMELVEIHEAWEAETRNLEYFIRTSARPHLFFLPKSHTPESTAKLEESKRILQGIVADRRKQLEEEIQEIMSNDNPEKLDDEGEGDEETGMEGDDSMVTESQKNKNKSQAAVANEESDLDDDGNVAVDYGLSGNIEITEKFGDSKAAARGNPGIQDGGTKGNSKETHAEAQGDVVKGEKDEKKVQHTIDKHSEKKHKDERSSKRHYRDGNDDKHSRGHDSSRNHRSHHAKDDDDKDKQASDRSRRHSGSRHRRDSGRRDSRDERQGQKERKRDETKGKEQEEKADMRNTKKSQDLDEPHKEDKERRSKSADKSA